MSSASRNVAVAASAQGKFWNRENQSSSQALLDSTPVVKQAKILSLTDDADDANWALNKAKTLPEGSSLLAILTPESLQDNEQMEQLRKEEPNVIFVSHPLAREPLAQLLETIPSIEWIHARSAGIDFITSPTLSKECASRKIPLTNAKGTFSSTLAEYTLMACSYFAKDLPRLLAQKAKHDWTKYPVLELRGATLGVVGYGDIGRACARLAKAYGMRVLGLRRRKSTTDDPNCDQMLDANSPAALNELFAQSDYVVVALPLTDATRGMITGDLLENHAKQDLVLINVGRGPIIDEPAMIAALKSKRIKGAGLDVTAVEPLPSDSELWDLDNVLLSPHNMDMTATFMHEATDFFLEENLPRFVRDLPLLNPVDPAAGY